MTEDEVQAIRRQKLAAWIDAAGEASAICKKRGLPKAAESYISQILSGYSFGGRAARSMEKKLGITEGDLEPTATTSIQSPQPAPSMGLFYACIV